MIYKISPRPSLPSGQKLRALLKRGREKAEMPHSITRRALNISKKDPLQKPTIFI